MTRARHPTGKRPRAPSATWLPSRRAAAPPTTAPISSRSVWCSTRCSPDTARSSERPPSRHSQHHSRRTAAGGAAQSIRSGAPPLDRRAVSGEAPGRSVRVDARFGEGSGEARDHLSELGSTPATATSAIASPPRIAWREAIAWGLVAALVLAVGGLLVRQRIPAAGMDRTVQFTITPPRTSRSRCRSAPRRSRCHPTAAIWRSWDAVGTETVLWLRSLILWPRGPWLDTGGDWGCSGRPIAVRLRSSRRIG